MKLVKITGASLVILVASFLSVTTPRQVQAFNYKMVAAKAASVALITGLYATGYFAKNPMKGAWENTVEAWTGQENLDPEYKSVAKSTERMTWAVLGIATYNGLVLIGVPAPLALAGATAFGAGQTAPFIFDGFKKSLQTWGKTLSANPHFQTIKQWYTQPHYDLVHPIKSFHTTEPTCGPNNPQCIYNPNEHSSDKLSLDAASAAADTLPFPWKDTLMLASDAAQEAGLMLIGFFVGYQSYKTGSNIGRTSMQTFVPAYTDNNMLRELHQRPALHQGLYILHKGIQKYLEAYGPVAFYSPGTKELVATYAKSNTTAEHLEAGYALGLGAEILVYVPVFEHMGLFKQIAQLFCD